MKHISQVSIVLAILVGLFGSVLADAKDRPRVIVMTDIGGDPDDQQTMVRFLSYANEFEIKGLYATSTHANINVAIIRDMVQAWGSTRGNLTQHARNWPTKDHLLGVIRAGRPVGGVYWCGIGNGVRDPETGTAGGICGPGVDELIGEGKDSEASEHLISVIDASTNPTWVLAWGGSRELAQAIWKVQADRTATQLNTFIRRIRLYSISLQDETLPWLIREFPALFIIRTTWSHRGFYRYDKLDTALLNSHWLNTHVRNAHGPLGAMYPGKVSGAHDRDGMKEGDTPAVTYLIPNGLSDPHEPEMGSWGGRFHATLGNKHWFEAGDDNPYSDNRRLCVYWSVSRWHTARQNDFEARMDWQRTGVYEEANHNPIVILNGDATKVVMRQTVAPGTTVHLSADGSSDPDGDALNYRWWNYYEADGYNGKGPDGGPAVAITNATSRNARFTAPLVGASTDIHIILEATDDGVPPLTSYRRIVFTVRPAE